VDVRWAAMEILGKRSDLSEKIGLPVAVRLEHQNRHVRRAAIELLKRRSDWSEEVLQRVAARLEHQAGYVRQAAVEVLVSQDSMPQGIIAKHMDKLYDALVDRSFSHHITWTFLDHVSIIGVDSEWLRAEFGQSEMREMIQEKQNHMVRPH
jgi:hypothetical protein